MGQSLAQLAYNAQLYGPTGENRDPWASDLYTKGYINPAVDDVFRPDTANRVFQQYILPS